MHPTVAYELAKLKIADSHADAARERLIRGATARSPQSIDAVGLRERLARLLNGHGWSTETGQPRPAGA